MSSQRGENPGWAGEVGNELGRARWGRTVQVSHVRFESRGQLQGPRPQSEHGREVCYVLSFRKLDPAKVTHMVRREKTEGEKAG